MFWVCVIPALFTLWIRGKRAREPGVARASAAICQARKASWRPARTEAVGRRASSKPDMIGTTVQTPRVVIGAFMCIYYSVNFWSPTFLIATPTARCCRISRRSTSGAIAGTATFWGRLSEGRLGRRGAATINVVLGIASLPLYLHTSDQRPARNSARPRWASSAWACGAWRPAYSNESLPDRSARRGRWLRVSRRRGDRRDDADAARVPAVIRASCIVNAMSAAMVLSGVAGHGHLDWPRDSRPRLQMMQDTHEVYAVRYAHHDPQAATATISPTSWGRSARHATSRSPISSG